MRPNFCGYERCKLMCDALEFSGIIRLYFISLSFFYSVWCSTQTLTGTRTENPRPDHRVNKDHVHSDRNRISIYFNRIQSNQPTSRHQQRTRSIVNNGIRFTHGRIILFLSLYMYLYKKSTCIYSRGKTEGNCIAPSGTFQRGQQVLV
jgi:hypothetical protein